MRHISPLLYTYVVLRKYKKMGSGLLDPQFYPTGRLCGAHNLQHNKYHLPWIRAWDSGNIRSLTLLTLLALLCSADLIYFAHGEREAVGIGCVWGNSI